MARRVYKYKIKLKGKEKQELRQAKKAGRQNGRLVTRILIILWADKGKTQAETADLLDCCEQTVLNQRQRFLQRRAAGPVEALKDLPRSGRPVTYGAKEQAQVVAVVCETLKERQLPLSRLSTADLHRVMVSQEGLANLSHASLGRILKHNVLKPWQYQHWLFPRDPDFVAKACLILDLYAGFWEGQPLDPNEFVLSADEKPIQVLSRRHDSLIPTPGHIARVEWEYKRLGTFAYHAAWDVFRAKIFGHIVPKTCIATFNPLVHRVMAQQPYQSSARTFWIVDGGCAHHRNTFPARLRSLYSNAVAVHLPTHSSWLNQIEIYFSIVQRKVLTPMDVPDKEFLTARLLDFQDYYEHTARPFSWKFTTADLKKRLETLENFMSI